MRSNYLGGHQTLRGAALNWISPFSLNEDPALPLITELNVWSPGSQQTVAPHGPNSAIYEEGDATNPNAGGKSSKTIGAIGGNVGLLDGSANWKQAAKMTDYRLSLNVNELYGMW